MLTTFRTLTAAAGLGLMIVVFAARPAAGQVDPTPSTGCEADPTAAECQDDGDPPGAGDSSPGSGRTCSFNGIEVPCETSYGAWIGDAIDGDWHGINGDSWPALLVGCWATVTSADREPPTTYPGDETAGAWYTLSCLGPGGTWPTPGPVEFGLAWTADSADAGPDPEELARRALASITLVPPQVKLNPPATGSVPLGMPVWLAVQETGAGWGPIDSGPVCDQGLCVTVTAVAEHVDWELGDGASVSCGRGQNTAWRPGMEFLSPPEDACHHFYQQVSRDEPGGSYRASAMVTWRAEWEGGGQSGVFEDLTDVCGAGGDEPCTATVSITVEEIQVVSAR